MNSGASDRVWSFGDVVFDATEGRLVVAGRPVEIDRNCRALLTALLQNAGAEVSKERLLEAGWPNRIVHENSLAKAIGRLRQVLGECGQALETVYGHGYKLNVKVSAPPARAAPEPAVDAPVATPSEPSTRRRRAMLLAGGALLALYDYDVVISDMGRGEDRLAGLKLAGQMRLRGDKTPLIIYTVRPDGEEAQRAQRELVAEAG